ncbi:hypothetical protein HanPI659440_Chr15g0609611 [Helianthus annuus]|nr:hypothetical protein HanPI659440_Chr15g0609611 [Helianthus annuus]
MLQRQIMFKQLEELQRQQKLQELNGSRQQHVLSQQSLIPNKQALGAQYAPLINGTPVRDASQMFMFGNTNLAHGYQSGFPYSQAQNQVLQSMGLASQPVDGHSVGQFFNLQGETRESTGEQVDTNSRSCVSDQFNVSYQQEQDIINPSQEFTSLDPLERKFLYDTNDDNLGGFGNMFDDTDKEQAFPTLQSGSWSALMQSALEETSSTDTGMQEEWSGLSFQNPEVPNDNQPSGLMESGKNLTPWQNSTLSGIQQSHKEAGEFEFVNDASNNGTEFKKDVLSGNQRHSASDVTTFRSSDSSDKSAGFPAPDLSSQTSRNMLELLHTVDKFRGYKHGTQSAYTNSDPTNEMMPKAENTDVFTPSRNSSGLQYSGLMMGPTAQRPPLNYFDLSQISQQVDNSHLVTLKDQDGRRSLIFEGQQVSKSTKQTHISPLNPAYSDANTRTAVKSEKADSDTKVPQLTSMSQLTSVYEKYKTMLMPSAASDGQSVKNSSHLSLQEGYPLYGNSPSVQMNLASTSQYGRVWPVTGTSSRASDQDLLVPQSKKRKFPTYELLPWHKEAAKGSSRPHDMSTAEVEWAQAAKRVPEMLKEEAAALGMVHSKKRVILTTQLMQVLFRPAPAAILSDDAAKCYNTLTYFAARLALGDACSLSNRVYMSCNTPESLSVKASISKGSGDQNLSKIVEDFIKRAKELEDDLLRFENRGSVLEIKMEAQDLERFSVINRFAKFHSRAQMVVAETASSGGASAPPKLYPQRYVKANPMPMTVPQGYNCLSL